MANRSPLETLIELAVRETDDAAKKLGAAIRAAQDHEKKLTMLQDYRDDYAQRLQTSQINGITPMQYRNFQAFLAKLDNAIKGQAQFVQHAKQRIDLERATWQEAERKRLSYNTLQNRADKEALQRENKRDQKLMDERATRQAFYKR